MRRTIHGAAWRRSHSRSPTARSSVTSSTCATACTARSSAPSCCRVGHAEHSRRRVRETAMPRRVQVHAVLGPAVVADELGHRVDVEQHRARLGGEHPQSRVEAREPCGEQPAGGSARKERRHEQDVAARRPQLPDRGLEPAGERIGLVAPADEIVRADQHGHEVGPEFDGPRHLRRDGIIDPATAHGEVGVADLFGGGAREREQHGEPVGPAAVVPFGHARRVAQALGERVADGDVAPPARRCDRAGCRDIRCSFDRHRS